MHLFWGRIAIIEKRWKFVIQYYFNAWTFTSLLAIGKFLPFPKTNKRLYCCKLIPLFFDVYCNFREAYFQAYFLLQMTDVLRQTAAAVANYAARSAWTFKLKFFEMRSTTCNGYALFAEKMLHELYNLYTYIVKIRDLSVEKLCVEKYDISKNLVAQICFCPFTKFNYNYFSNFLVHRSFPFYRLSTSGLYSFMRTI